MSHLVAVLYEDQRGTVRRGFGLHALACALVADACGRTLDDIKCLIHGSPKKGNAKLWAACKDDAPRILASSVRRVVAVVDRDRLHELVRVEPAACRARLVEAFRAPCSATAEQLRIVLLERNVESVVDAVARIVGATEARRLAALAKDTDARDGIFHQAAHHVGADVRARILQAVPALEHLCRQIASALPPSPQPQP